MASQVLKDLNAKFKEPVYSTLCSQYTALDKKREYPFNYNQVYLTESLMPFVVMWDNSSFVNLNLSLEPEGVGGIKQVLV